MNTDTFSNMNLGIDGTRDALTKSIAAGVLSAIRTDGPQKANLPTLDAQPSFVEFLTDLEKLVGANADLRQEVDLMFVKAARQSLVASGAAVPSADDLLGLIQDGEARTKGGTKVRTFFWGFRIELSHSDLKAFVNSGQLVSLVLAALGTVTGPAAPFIEIAAVFIAGALALLKSIDRGKGIVISMSWFAPGVFVPKAA